MKNDDDYFSEQEIQAAKTATINIVANLNRKVPSKMPLAEKELEGNYIRV